MRREKEIQYNDAYEIIDSNIDLFEQKNKKGKNLRKPIKKAHL